MTQPEPYPLDEPKPGNPGAAPLTPKIEKPGLMEGFEEDADFTKDPELDRVVLGEPSRPAVVAAAPAAPKDELVKPFWPWEDKLWAGLGVLLLIAAMIASGINVLHAVDKPALASQRILSVLLTLYNTLLHTGTGLAAVFAAAVLLGQRVGRIETAAARMFAAVAAFEFLYNLNFTITTGKTEEVVLAAAGYLGLIAASFRLFKRDPFLYVIGLHFAIWLVVQVGMLLSAAAAAKG